MMWKDEIYTAHVDIDLFSVSPEITSTTLYMPSWSSFECFCSIFCLKLCLPKIFTISAIVSFPESEIADTFFFIFILFDSRPGFHPFHVEMREVTIFFEAFDVKIDRAIVTYVGVF